MTKTRSAYAVIGDPVEHSLSPKLFSRLFKDLGVDAHYTALRVEASQLTETIDHLRRGSLQGVSVTIPHKETLLPLLDALHPLAARIGAVNCVRRTSEGVLEGYNTDAHGFRLALEAGGRRLAASRMLLLGAGGAARAAAFAAVTAGAKGLTIANRDPERAMSLGLELVGSGRAWPEGALLRRWEEDDGKALARRAPMIRRLAAPSGKCYVQVVPLEAEALAHPLSHSDLLINATSVGLNDPSADPLPRACELHQRLLVLDMVYQPLRTALLRRAEGHGAATVDGLWMLVYQALEQLRIWTGQTAAPAIAERIHRYLREDPP